MACDKVDLPDKLRYCVEAEEISDGDDFGVLTFHRGDSIMECPVTVMRRNTGLFELQWYEFDRSCYRYGWGSILYFSNTDPEQSIEVTNTYHSCEIDGERFSFGTPIFMYSEVDHDAFLSTLSVDAQKTEYNLTIDEYNSKRDYIRGHFYATLYRDTSCGDGWRSFGDSVMVIERAVFEAPVRNL